jgi:hypothetical protein
VTGSDADSQGDRRDQVPKCMQPMVQHAKDDHEDIVDVEDEQTVEIVNRIDDEMNEGGRGDRVCGDVGKELPPADEAIRRRNACEEIELDPRRKPWLASRQRPPNQKLSFRRHAGDHSKGADVVTTSRAAAKRIPPALPIRSEYYLRCIEAAKCIGKARQMHAGITRRDARPGRRPALSHCSGGAYWMPPLVHR